jgi:AcrR family transcriptional regulator
MPEKNEPETLGLRERNKRDKVRRIKDAARSLFLEKGYENTTIRQITKRADVGIGTIFRYAANKRDLLFFIYNDLRADYPVLANKDISRDLSVTDQLSEFFGHLLGFFATQPELARDILREASLYDTGLQVERYWQIRKAAETRLTELLAENQEIGRIDPGVDLDSLTTMLFDIYRSALRRWVLEDGSDADAGMSMMRPLFELALTGITTELA